MIKILSVSPTHKNKDGKEADSLENITDIDADFEHLVVLNDAGEIVYLRDKN